MGVQLPRSGTVPVIYVLCLTKIILKVWLMHHRYMNRFRTVTHMFMFCNFTEARNGYDNLVLEDALDDTETTLGQGNAAIIPKPLEMTGRKKPLRIRGMSGPVSAIVSVNNELFFNINIYCLLVNVMLLAYSPIYLSPFAAVSLLGIAGHAETFPCFWSVAHSSLIFQSFRSLLTVSYHHNIGLPLGRFPSIFIFATARMFSVSSIL